MKLRPEDLESISKKMKASTDLRDGESKAKITVHMGTCGIASGAREIMKAFMNELESSGAQNVLFTTSGCAGLCSHEPMATVEVSGQAPVKYVELNEAKVKRIFAEHVVGGTAISEFALAQGSERIV